MSLGRAGRSKPAPRPRSTEIHSIKPSKSRRRVPAVGLSVIAVLAVTAAACGSSGPSEGALAGKTATGIVSRSVVAFHAQRSVSFVTKTVSGKTTTIESGASSRDGSAAENVTANGSPVIQAILVDHVAYVRAGAAVLEQAFKLSASVAAANAGKWISLKDGDAAYQGVVDTLTPTQAIAQFVPNDPGLHVAGITSIGGKNAVAVAGSPDGSVAAGNTGTATIFVSTAAPYLPLSSTLVVKTPRGETTERIAAVYGKWNQKVDPIAPKNATPISSLTT